MHLRRMGTSDLHVSPLALGTWAMGGSADSWGPVDDRESIAAIQQSLDSGVNLIDTAPIYGWGHSEEIVGKAIQGRRHEVLLATKCGLMPGRPGEPPVRCLKRQRILEECHASLRRLRTEVIDLYQCHWPDPTTPIRETMSAMTELLHRGTIRAIGLSNFAVEEITAAREFGPVHCLQSPLSMLHPRAISELLPYCMEHHIGFLAYSPLAKGLLSGKFDERSSFSGIRARDVDFVGSRYRSHLNTIERLRGIADTLKISLAQLALAWTIAQPGVTSAIAGAKRPSQVLENAAGAAIVLNDADRASITRILNEASSEP